MMRKLFIKINNIIDKINNAHFELLEKLDNEQKEVMDNLIETIKYEAGIM